MERKKGTGKFIVQIDHCENATWQGTVTWTDKNISQNFRSALELIKLIDSTVSVQKEKAQA